MLGKIKAYICAKYDVSFSEIQTQNRTSNIVTARKEFIWTLSKFTTLSSPEIGRIVKRDHSTVLHNIRRADELIAGGYMKPGFDDKADYQVDMAQIKLDRIVDDLAEEFKLLLNVRMQQNKLDAVHRLIGCLLEPRKGS
jgi:hypothetical protein|tara:strand:- start:844 stop:1260 length:417 start_codon:yes stop_codon:yes gene_type:complete